MQRHFISYPKSGRSWLRYILAQLGHEPLVRFQHDGFEFNDGAKPALDFSLAARLARYAEADRLVYLERDPRDVMVSLYFQVTGRFRDFFGYTGTISDFIRDDYFGADNLRRFRDLWHEIAVRREVLVVTYEGCHADMPGTARRVLQYYGLSIVEPLLAGAVANAQFDRMRQLERSGLYPQPWLRLRNGAAKVRAGQVGGFRTALAAEDIAYLDRAFGRTAA
jgi:Sulfotransferase domain